MYPNQLSGSQVAANSDCKAETEPALRERLERALSILEMAQHAVNDINCKLFNPKPEECNKNGPEYTGTELEFLIEKACRLASRLESSLVYINDKP